MKDRGPQSARRNARSGMTLIELIVVMWLLATVLALSTPTLSGFFRGRSLQEEGRRLLALTRYARSEAASRCVPMELWIDGAAGQYGLRPQSGYEDGDESTAKTVEFTV